MTNIYLHMLAEFGQNIFEKKSLTKPVRFLFPLIYLTSISCYIASIFSNCMLNIYISIFPYCICIYFPQMHYAKFLTLFVLKTICFLLFYQTKCPFPNFDNLKYEAFDKQTTVLRRKQVRQ